MKCFKWNLYFVFFSTRYWQSLQSHTHTNTHTHDIVTVAANVLFLFFPIFFFAIWRYRTLKGTTTVRMRWHSFFSCVFFFSSVGWYFRRLPIHDEPISREIPKPNELKRFRGFLLLLFQWKLYYITFKL